MGSYLTDRTQFVRVNGVYSESMRLYTGVPQGSILGPLLFSIYTSNIFHGLQYVKVHMYADDSQLEYAFNTDEIDDALLKINNDLAVVAAACSEHQLVLNATKTAAVLFGRANDCARVRHRVALRMGTHMVPLLDNVKNLGVVLENNFRYRLHISNCIRRAYAGLRVLFPHRSYLNQKTKALLCNALVLSNFAYCSPVYGPALDLCDRNRVQRVQNACLRYIFGLRKFEHVSHKLISLGWLNMRNRYLLQAACLFFQVLTLKSPPYLYLKITFRTDVHNLNVRFKGLMTPPRHRSVLFQRSFTYTIYRVFNRVPHIFKARSLLSFKKNLTKMLLASQSSGSSIFS